MVEGRNPHAREPRIRGGGKWLLILAAAAVASCSDGSGGAPAAINLDGANSGGVADSALPGGGPCAAGQTLCGGSCVDLQSNSVHCGACASACAPGSSCTAGVCSCQAGLTSCDGTCVDTGSDARHCGACGAACSADQVCADGLCGSTCPPGTTQCGSSCVDASSNPLHCGLCDNACTGGQGCLDGTCVCAAGQQLCGGSCVDTGADPSNCGGCGIHCTAAHTCTAGTCVGGGTGGPGTAASGTGGSAPESAGGSGTGTEPDNGAGGDPTGTGGEPAGTGGEPAGTGGDPAGTGGEPAGTGGEPAGTGGEPAGTGGEPAGTGGEPAGTGGEPAGTGGAGGSGNGASPSNPNADCAARSLLQYLYDIMGTNTLSGQESMFGDGNGFPSQRDSYIQQRTGQYPALYSSDFGDFSTRNLADRQRVVDNALAYWRQGSIIQLHYHIVQPDQPDGAGFETMSQFSAENPYPASNIDQILTSGTELNREHLRRLDTLAGYLGQLQQAGVPVLWRPFHEMNGGWFWWGMQPRFADLWIQMWEYLTDTHGLNNLLWVFSVNHWQANGNDAPSNYYPGHDYVDVVGVDVYLEYDHNYDQYVHDTLMSVGGGRPIAFTENGQMPDIPAISGSQPNWVFWSTWWGFEGADSGNSDQLYSRNYGDPRVITQDEVSLPDCD